jgi:hypothetical protein
LKCKLIFLALTLTIAACAPVETISTATSIPSTITPTSSLVPSHTPTITKTPEPTVTLPPTQTDTFTPTITPTASTTPEPTYTVIRGVINQEHVNCYYGPSKAYLYKYGLLKGNRLDIIGYLPDTSYIEVQAIGGDNPCWMNLEFMDIQGDINTVKPVDPLTIKIPWSPYYPGLAFAKAERSGNEITITWSPLKLRAGDDSEQESYLLETWVCRNGKLTFVPIGAYQNQVKVMDEPGCNEPSHGRVYGVEKHGYTKYLMFDWPQAEEQLE